MVNSSSFLFCLPNLNIGMRTYIYLFLITSLVIANWAVHAQTSKFNLGVIGGPSYSFDYTKKNIDYATYRLLYTVGLTAQAKLNEHVSLTTNLLFEQKGEIFMNLKPQIKTSNSKLDFAITSSYITLPIMCNYSFGKSNRFSLSAGPYISYLLHEKGELLTDNVISSTQRITSFSNPISAGLCLNLGTTFPIANQLNAHIFIRNNLDLISDRNKFNTTQLLFAITYNPKQ